MIKNAGIFCYNYSSLDSLGFNKIITLESRNELCVY